MHEPPVQSDRCALSGNYRLESNPERHANAPLAAATGNRMCERYCESSWSGALTTATLEGQLGWHVSHKTVTTVQKFPNLLNLRKTALQGGFFFRLQRKRLRRGWMNLKISFSLPPDHSKFWGSSDLHPVICYIPTTGHYFFWWYVQNQWLRIILAALTNTYKNSGYVSSHHNK